MSEAPDFVSGLSESFPHLFDCIFFFLDVKSLGRAEVVCKKWREGILSRKIWKRFLLAKQTVFSTWSQLEKWNNFPSGDEDEVLDSKTKWTALYVQQKALENNWQSATFTVKRKLPAEVNYFTMNSTHIMTTEGDVIKFWNRRTLHCEKELVEKGRNIVGLDCNDDYLITAADRDCFGFSTGTGDPEVSIVCRSLKTNEMIFRVVEGTNTLLPSVFGAAWGCHEACFKVRLNHNLLVSHRLIPNSNVAHDEGTRLSRLVLRRFNGRSIEAPGFTQQVAVDASDVYPIYVGHDDKYVVLHYHDSPRFELISCVTRATVRTIDSLDNCSSVQYGNGLIVSASAQMGTHSRTTCVLRLWDAETGDCIREIIEPEPSRYHNLGHLIAFNSRFLISVPDLPNALPRVLRIRDLQAALNSCSTPEQLLKATHTSDWSVSTWDFIMVDDFQILYFHDPAFEPSALFVFSLVPSS